VNFFLSEKDNAWLTDILGNVFLPEHIWSNVAEYDKYTPRNSQEGVVGSHAFQIREFNWENWYELEPREPDAIPWNEAFDFLDSGGPFVDTVRMEVFGSQNALDQAILNADIDQTYGTVEIEQAAQATDRDNLEVLNSQDDGYGHLSFNVRRIPFDDRAFRQLLVKLLDEQWVVENLYRGVGVERGTYATPTAYTSWRPPEPGEVDGDYEGIQIPDTSFPGQAGQFNISQSGIDAARQYLIDNENTKHDYSLGQAQSPQLDPPDGQELYVNGQPMAQAHTDNDGNGGQGPLEISINPPDTEPKRTELINRLVDVYGKVGIPAVTAVQSFNSQLPKIYANEDFDMYEMGWTGLAWNNDHYTQFYSSDGADLDGSADSQLFNSMGYTGADDLIGEQAGMMQPEPRKPIVKQVLAQIYRDAPTNILNHARVLQPVTNRFSGQVQVVGGVTNSYTWLNIRQSQQG
jgi:peptide/nickel transport system substrate-binding protein